MPSTPSTLATLMFVVSTFAPFVLLIAGVAFGLVTRAKS